MGSEQDAATFYVFDTTKRDISTVVAVKHRLSVPEKHDVLRKLHALMIKVFSEPGCCVL